MYFKDMHVWKSQLVIIVNWFWRLDYARQC